MDYYGVYYTHAPDELYHYGVQGMKWGVRRYQYKDGSLTPRGEKRRQIDSMHGAQKQVALMKMKVSDITASAATKITGKQYADEYLKKGTTFNRIQTSKEFENFAFYATYKKADSDKYMGLFGKNLKSRANRAAREAEKVAAKTGLESDILNAKNLRETSDNLKVYQLSIEATKKLKIPSDENAGQIVSNLLKDSTFKDNVKASIDDSKSKMLRPTQQMLFKQAQNALTKDPGKLSKSERTAVYKALNLSLTNHNAQEVAAQDTFYKELKKKGYNALLDYNDKEYSSYHAKRPTIVFDTDAVKLKSIAETNPKVVDKMYAKYNTERVTKEAIANTLGLVSRIGSTTVSECSSYVDKKMNDYLGGGSK